MMIMILMLKLNRGDRKIRKKLIGTVIRKFKLIMRKRRRRSKRKKKIICQRDNELV